MSPLAANPQTVTAARPSNAPNATHWDIFCAVVDNYGDIGVTWRLAKQLAEEYALPVNLWVDCLASFGHILPALDPKLSRQTHEGVTILKWSSPLEETYVAGAVLIEAFACELPDDVKSAVKSAIKPPVWLNLEYLSAEAWVDGCHGLPSFQPGGMNKYFYMPGFSAESGGLICETDLFAKRDAWQSNNQSRLTLFTSLGLKGIEENDTVISVFSYESQALPALCELWSEGTQRVHLLIPKGRSFNSLAALLPCPAAQLTPGQHIVHGKLHIHVLPMTNQQGYDQLLWSCDFNIVRGEDSFLRAQWAAKPFIWHIYPQDEDYHLVKLEAFMRRYCDNLAPEIAHSWQQLNLSFNQQAPIEARTHWINLSDFTPALLRHAKQWPVDALKSTDLAARLVQFVKNR